MKEQINLGYIHDSKSEQITNNNQHEKVQIQRNLGMWSGIAIIVGTIIGSGIWVTPGSIMQYSESVGIYMLQWAVCGVLSALGAMCYIELACVVPLSGGIISEIFSYNQWNIFLNRRRNSVFKRSFRRFCLLHLQLAESSGSWTNKVNSTFYSSDCLCSDATIFLVVLFLLVSALSTSWEFILPSEQQLKRTGRMDLIIPRKLLELDWWVWNLKFTQSSALSKCFSHFICS